MKDDPIRAALEKAGVEHAAPIAMFLRALPLRFTTRDGDQVTIKWGGAWHELAAAVERAAKEAGDG